MASSAAKACERSMTSVSKTMISGDKEGEFDIGGSNSEAEGERNWTRQDEGSFGKHGGEVMLKELKVCDERRRG